ncbi:hypothetical protein SUTMEG_18200 [Sutterella megalosphaeroides]|uniref:Uncharacterized protein n=1 Tax=Sutterella megalosphaeroides TaxID=2494234 RepID=A0A2Z6IBP4_9BURK|nr:hypothetical protein SUTMEG_18200 [Sutterella megalosphaeroides]
MIFQNGLRLGCRAFATSELLVGGRGPLGLRFGGRQKLRAHVGDFKRGDIRRRQASRCNDQRGRKRDEVFRRRKNGPKHGKKLNECRENMRDVRTARLGEAAGRGLVVRIAQSSGSNVARV